MKRIILAIVLLIGTVAFAVDTPTPTITPTPTVTPTATQTPYITPQATRAAPNVFNITTSSTLLYEAGKHGPNICLSNTSNEAIDISLNYQALSGRGIRILANGQYTIYNFTGSIYAICASGSKNLQAMDW